MNNRPPFLLQILGLFLIAIGILHTLAGVGVALAFLFGSFFPGGSSSWTWGRFLALILLLPGIMTVIGGWSVFVASRLAWVLVIPAGVSLFWLISGEGQISLVGLFVGESLGWTVDLISLIVYLFAIYIIWKNRHNLR